MIIVHKGRIIVECTDNEKTPLADFFSKGRSISDIEPYFNVLPALDSAAGGEGVEVLFCILSRQGEGGEHQEVRS